MAQGLAWGLGCQLFPIDSLLVVAEDARWQLEPDAKELEVTVLMDARMDEVYAAAYQHGAGGWVTQVAPQLYTLGALADAWQAAPPRATADCAKARPPVAKPICAPRGS